MDGITIIFSIIILIISVIFHELAHGTVAYQLGDPTAKLAGRLTLNPLSHLELVGSFIVPVFCILTGSGFILGWAKPVPFNAQLLKYKRFGPALVAIAGPATNVIIAVIGAGVLRIFTSQLSIGFSQMLVYIVSINVALAVFNMIPIPPLDGHHILGSIFPKFRMWSEQLLRKYGLIVIIAVIFLAGSVISPVILFFTRLLLGF